MSIEKSYEHLARRQHDTHTMLLALINKHNNLLDRVIKLEQGSRTTSPRIAESTSTTVGAPELEQPPKPAGQFNGEDYYELKSSYTHINALLRSPSYPSKPMAPKAKSFMIAVNLDHRLPDSGFEVGEVLPIFIHGFADGAIVFTCYHPHPM